MSHLVDLVAEYYSWQGYFVKKRVCVGRTVASFHALTLDVIAFAPDKNRAIHVEASIDSSTWADREEKFQQKIQGAKTYFAETPYKWLHPDIELEHVAIFVNRPKRMPKLLNATLYSIDEFMAEIRRDVLNAGYVSRGAIPSVYPMMRTIQLVECGYIRAH